MKGYISTAALCGAVLAAAVSYGATDATASSGRCDAPRTEWQSKEALQAKLEGAGWTVRRIKTEGGCYEAYAVDDRQRRVEAYFDPKTFEMVKLKADD